MKTLDGIRIALLIHEGTDRADLLLAREALILAGAETVLVSPRGGDIPLATASADDDRITADADLDGADGYDALVVPGGAAAGRLLADDQQAVTFIDSFPRSGRPVAAIGHGVLPVLRTGRFAGYRVSAVGERGPDGGRAVVVDRGLVTCRSAGGLTDFNNAMVECFAGALSPGDAVQPDA